MGFSSSFERRAGDDEVGQEGRRAGGWYQPVEEHSSTNAPQESYDALLVGQREAPIAAGGRLLDLQNDQQSASSLQERSLARLKRAELPVTFAPRYIAFAEKNSWKNERGRASKGRGRRLPVHAASARVCCRAGY